MYKTYTHHDTTVTVRSDLKGKHREHCLCFSCQHFKPNETDNCPIAKTVFDTCVLYNIVSPV